MQSSEGVAMENQLRALSSDLSSVTRENQSLSADIVLLVSERDGLRRELALAANQIAQLEQVSVGNEL
jgi:predicted  nucleic acid-binding Zn-ribbon protein